MQLVITFVLLLILLLQPRTILAAVRISEIYPAPSSGSFEWVELFNDSSTSSSLQQYQLVDATNHFIQIPNITLQPHEYMIATSSGILNNSGDTVYLKLNSITVDTSIYSGTVSAQQSFVLCDGEWIIVNNITPAFENESCISDTILAHSPTDMPTGTLTPTQYVLKSSPSVKQHEIYPTVVKQVLSSRPTPTLQLYSKKHAVKVLKSTAEPTPQHPTLEPFYIGSCKKFDIDSYRPVVTLIIACSLTIVGLVSYSVFHKVKETYYNEE